MRISLLLAAWLAAAAGAFAEEAPGEPDPYPERRITELVSRSPCKPGADGLELKDIPFSSKMALRKQRRDTSKPAMELLRRWAVKLGTAQHMDLFGKDLRVEDAGGAWWIAVPADLLTLLDRELRNGDTAWFFMSFVGCSGKEPVFALEEYQPPVYDDLEEEAASYIT